MLIKCARLVDGLVDWITDRWWTGSDWWTVWWMGSALAADGGRWTVSGWVGCWKIRLSFTSLQSATGSVLIFLNIKR